MYHQRKEKGKSDKEEGSLEGRIEFIRSRQVIPDMKFKMEDVERVNGLERILRSDN